MLHIIKRVRRGPQPHNRPAGIRVVDDLLHLVIRQFQIAREEDHQIRLAQRFETRNVVHRRRINRAGFAIDGIKHGAAEAVPDFENPSQRRDGFLRPVFLIARDKNDVLSVAHNADQHCNQDGPVQ